jgi:hypothetical protein
MKQTIGGAWPGDRGAQQMPSMCEVGRRVKPLGAGTSVVPARGQPSKACHQSIGLYDIFLHNLRRRSSCSPWCIAIWLQWKIEKWHARSTASIARQNARAFPK